MKHYTFLISDKTEAKCIPTKDYAGTNVYAGMTGYDTFVGNPTDAIVDPGVKSRIFLHDCKFGYYSFISDVGGDLNCESDFSMKRISSMDAYDEERTSSNKFTMSASLAVTASYAGAKGEVAAAYSRATNADEQASVKVLNKYGGEIVQAKATCITMSVSIADNVRPLFTQDFVNHLRDMDEAIELNDEDEKTKTWKAFVTEFGTHFMRTTKLGAQIIYERRLETKATSTTEMKRRSECVAFEASASLKAEGYGSSVDAAASGGRDDCEGVTQGSDFSQKEGFEGIKILSRGSRPTDLHSWVDQEFDPVPVERYLEPISVLFRNNWLAKSTFFGFEKSLNGEKIEEMFLEKVKSYCSIMLDSTLDADCNYKGTE
jgi:C1A family cysteine protease